MSTSSAAAHVDPSARVLTVSWRSFEEARSTGRVRGRLDRERVPVGGVSGGAHVAAPQAAVTRDHGMVDRAVGTVAGRLADL